MGGGTSTKGELHGDGKKENLLKRLISDMARRFPSLVMLDQEAITTIGFDAPGPSSGPATEKRPIATTFPHEMKPSFITGVEDSIISNFLVR